MEWNPPLKPAETAENHLIDAIIEGHFPIGSTLPAERELASRMGVTRPTLREALQRLGRDGWVEIHHGKPTRVRDYWHEGNLGVLGAIARRSQNLPADFVPNLLFVRQLMAPAYARLAVQRQPEQLVAQLAPQAQLEDTPEAFAVFDWELHHLLTVLSGNPIFTLILNGFRELYHPMACLYFESQTARARSRDFYTRLLEAAKAGDPEMAEATTRSVMQDSLTLWRQAVPVENISLASNCTP
jgi:GntR family negative regulator for fad regulon and positive regulator of fabA